MTLTEELQRLPAQPISAVRVLTMVDDPNASTADLARVIETDPALSAQVLKLANSPYYGLSHNVGSAGRAVLLLGFTTVRALAVSGACSLLTANRGGQVYPPGFWPHAVTTAVACSALARRIGLAPADAFTIGLLHDIGAALLYRRNPETYQQIVDAADLDAAALLDIERREFGTTHPEAAADALDAWRLPRPFIRAIEQHHHDLEDTTTTMGRVLIVGEAVARHVAPTALHETVLPIGAAISAVGLRRTDLPMLEREVERELAQVAWFLEIGP
ncbi:MAG: HDOD domain-containing protein [Actinomycetota bacterium]